MLALAMANLRFRGYTTTESKTCVRYVNAARLASWRQRNRKNLEAITELCASGKVIPVIDKRYPLSKVPEALRDLGEGQQSKLVITVQ